MERSYLVVASISTDAAALLRARSATVRVLHHRSPHLELIELCGATYHGKHPTDGYHSYTLSAKGEGICYWDTDPLTCAVYRWFAGQPADTLLNGRLPWSCAIPPARPTHAEIVGRVTDRCARLLAAQPLPRGNAHEAQLAWLDEQQAALLQAVVTLLPEDVRIPVAQAIAHAQQLATPAPPGTPLGNLDHLGEGRAE